MQGCDSDSGPGRNGARMNHPDCSPTSALRDWDALLQTAVYGATNSRGEVWGPLRAWRTTSPMYVMTRALGIEDRKLDRCEPETLVLE